MLKKKQKNREEKLNETVEEIHEIKTENISDGEMKDE